jgi:DNA polymerase III subunit gamma/tau
MPDEVRSLYRRYRSRTFAELIGQEHVSQTLLNALESGRIAHAYLFAGPRGSGKTSAARILAKAVNCLTTGGRGEPCNTCEMCVAINEGRALDLIEIDAASNRGIDEIRDLRDKVHFSPTQARYKVYILDEAHMLTNEAFNALLKTLEEPPAHVIFALVTTEAHKIPPTILSRVQRFDFHRASARDLVAKLNHICQEEHIVAEPAALALIARTATGSYRDAESLLDQLSSFTGDQGLTLTYVQQVLGLAPLDATSKLIKCVAALDATAGLRLANEIIEGGADLRQFSRALVDYLRGLILIKSGNEAILDTTPDALETMRAETRSLTMAELVRLIKLFGDPEVTSQLRSSAQPQLSLELAIVEACGSSEAAQKPGSAPAVVAPAPPAVPGPAPEHPPATPALQAPAATSSAGIPPAASAHAPAAQPAHPAAASSTPLRTTAAAYAPAPRPASPYAAGTPARPYPAAPPVARPPAAAPRPPVQMLVTAPAGTPLYAVQDKWAAILDAVKASSRSVEAFLKECKPVEADEDAVVLGFRYPFHKDSVDNPKNRALVEECFSRVLTHAVRIRCILTPKTERGGGPVAEPAVKDGVVKAAEEMFKATVLTVEKTGE